MAEIIYSAPRIQRIHCISFKMFGGELMERAGMNFLLVGRVVTTGTGGHLTCQRILGKNPV